jgi:hypothetical protein
MRDESPDAIAFVAAKRLFEMAKVSCRQFIPARQQITIDFGIASGFPAPAKSAAPASGGGGGHGGESIGQADGGAQPGTTDIHAWYAGAMTREECGALVMGAAHGDFLIRDLAGGARSICVNDRGNARFYTIAVDPTTPGRWLFANYSHNSLVRLCICVFICKFSVQGGWALDPTSTGAGRVVKSPLHFAWCVPLSHLLGRGGL